MVHPQSFSFRSDDLQRTRQLAQSDIGHLAIYQIIPEWLIFPNLASDNVAKTEVKSKGTSVSSATVPLMIGFAAPYAVRRRARLRCAEINLKPLPLSWSQSKRR